MCWRKKCKDKPEPQIADKPITVYKIVDYQLDTATDKFYSLYARYLYEMDKLQPTIDIEVKDTINEGTWIISEGYHSYVSFDRACVQFKFLDGMCGDAIVECEIPAGTKYYVNRLNGEIVSEQIIVKKAIETINSECSDWYDKAENKIE